MPRIESQRYGEKIRNEGRLRRKEKNRRGHREYRGYREPDERKEKTLAQKLYNMKRNLRKRLQKHGDPTITQYQCMDFDLNESILSLPKKQPEETHDSFFESRNEKELKLLKGDIIIITDKYGIPCIIKATGQKTKELQKSVELAMREYCAARILSSDRIRHGRRGTQQRPPSLPISNEPFSTLPEQLRPSSSQSDSSMLDCITVRFNNSEGQQQPPSSPISLEPFSSLPELSRSLSSQSDSSILDCITVKFDNSEDQRRPPSPPISIESFSTFPELSRTLSSESGSSRMDCVTVTLNDSTGVREIQAGGGSQDMDRDSDPVNRTDGIGAGEEIEDQDIVSEGQLAGTSIAGDNQGSSGGCCLRVHRAFVPRLGSKKQNIKTVPGPAEAYKSGERSRALSKFATKIYPLTQLVEALFEVVLPQDHERYKKVFQHNFSELNDSVDRAFGIWSSRSLVMNAVTNLHYDLEDVCRGWCAITPFGDFRGGYACFPQLGVKIEAGVGSAIYLRSYAVAHYIGCYQGERLSLVHFTHQSVHDHFTQETGEVLWEHDKMPLWWQRSRQHSRK